MNPLINYIPLLLKGAGMTIAAWLVAGSIGLIIGSTFGILSCRYLNSPFMVPVRIYTFIARGIPAYVQILIAYFVIPSLLGANISGFLAATLALAFCSGGYMTEIIRAGINTVSVGQWDACLVLGYSFVATLRRIILPQTVRNVLPAVVGELEQLLKSTSLLATIGVTELTRTGMNIISRELNPFPVYMTIAAVYLLFSAVMQLVILYTERKLRYGHR